MSNNKGEPRNQRLLDADGHPCPYCGGTMDRRDIKMQPTSDHIRAKKRFRIPGSQSRMSLRKKGRTIIVCSECNFMKGTLTLEEFIADLIERNDRLRMCLYKNFLRTENIRYLLDIGLDKE